MGYTRGRRITHCPFCGTGYAPEAAWPRDCAGCGETNWANPLPVAVALQPVALTSGGRGLVVVRRDIEPCRGQLALPGGYMETGETWEQAAVRELWEETELRADAEQARLFDARSAVNTLNVFALLPERAEETLPESRPTAEATEWLVFQEPVDLAFPTHTDAMRAYFADAAALFRS